MAPLGLLSVILRVKVDVRLARQTGLKVRADKSVFRVAREATVPSVVSAIETWSPSSSIANGRA